MSRTLVIIRHAKSGEAKPLQSDFDRTLNDRGEEEAEEMGKKLRKADLKPDLIISSSAKRTRQTAKRIAKEVGYDTDDIIHEEKLYQGGPSAFEKVIEDVKDKAKTIFVVGHNPGISEFVNQLSDGFSVDSLPTCGIVAAQVEAEKWSDFSTAKRKVFLFEYPAK